LIVGIVGDETVEVLGSYIYDWVYQKINSVMDRAIEKGAVEFVTGSSPGVEKLVIKLGNKKTVPVSAICEFPIKIPGASITYHATWEFFVDYCDYIVCISNGQPHSRLDYIKAGKDHLQINYLDRSEYWQRF
jgi:hypothetical protein